MNESPRFKKGMETFRRLDDAAARNFVDNLKEFAPDLVQIAVEFAFGDVLSRDVLDMKSRELATVAMLASMAHAGPQLELHIGGALRAGATKDEIVEIILQVAVYAGFPAAINALRSAMRVLATSTASTQDGFWKS